MRLICKVNASDENACMQQNRTSGKKLPLLELLRDFLFWVPDTYFYQATRMIAMSALG